MLTCSNCIIAAPYLNLRADEAAVGTVGDLDWKVLP